MQDMTGKPVSKENIDEAIQVVSKFITSGITKLPPELAVQLLNIRRCLIELRATK